MCTTQNMVNAEIGRAQTMLSHRRRMNVGLHLLGTNENGTGGFVKLQQSKSGTSLRDGSKDAGGWPTLQSEDTIRVLLAVHAESASDTHCVAPRSRAYREGTASLPTAPCLFHGMYHFQQSSATDAYGKGISPRLADCDRHQCGQASIAQFCLRKHQHPPQLVRRQ